MTGHRVKSASARIDQSRPLSFTFDGHSYSGFAGDTLASALLAVILAFGLLIDRFGLALTAALLTIVAAFARGPRIEFGRQNVILTILVAILIGSHLLQIRLVTAVALLAIFVEIARGSIASRDVNLTETLLLAATLALFSVALFVYGLSQPFPAWWGR